ncbi:arylsulfatase [Acidobacteriota bacterium]
MKKLSRRKFMKSVGSAAVSAGSLSLLSGLGINGCRSVGEGTPNIVFIMADDLGYSELGCFGQKKIRTPNVDRLAAEGMRFTDFYSSSAVCAPARCSLMTGKHGGHAFVRDNHEIGEWDSFRGQLPLPEGTETIASVLKKQGYVTGCFGKWGLGEPGSSGDPLKLGFDRFYGYNCQRHAHNLYPRYLINDDRKEILEGNDRGLTGEKYAPKLIADEMLRFVRANQDNPFFLYYPTVIPHLPLQVPEDELQAYNGLWTETPYTGNSYLPHPKPRAAYAAMISYMDKQVGRLMALLKELDLDKNTIVFFTSDNGTTHLGDEVDFTFFDSVGGLKGLKGSLHEGGIRVPMVACWPGKIEAGTASSLPAAGYDMLATLAEIGKAQTENTDGLSILPTLLGRTSRQSVHDYLFWDFAGYGKQISVRMGKWKGIKTNFRDKEDVPLELYDLDIDPAEKNDVADQHPDIAARIEKIMLEARTRPQVDSFAFGPYKD